MKRTIVMLTLTLAVGIALGMVGSQVLNAQHAQKRATDYLRSYCDPSFKVDPPYEDWELMLHEPPPLRDLA